MNTAVPDSLYDTVLGHVSIPAVYTFIRKWVCIKTSQGKLYADVRKRFSVLSAHR